MPNFVFNANLLFRVHLTEQEAIMLPLIETIVRQRILAEMPTYLAIPNTYDLREILVEPVHDNGQGTTEIIEAFIGRLKK